MIGLRKKTVCIFSALYLPSYGGAERYNANLAKALAGSCDCRVIIITSSLGDNTGITEENGIEIVRIPCYLLLNNRFTLPKKNKEFQSLVDWLNKQPLDFVLINQRFYPISLFGMKYAQKRGVVPLVLDHGSAHLTMANSFLDFFIQRYEHMITNHGKHFENRYIAVSNTSAKWLNHFDIDVVGVVNNSIEANDFVMSASIRDFREELGISNDDFLVVFTGRLLKEKGLLQLSAAIEELYDQDYSDIHLVIAGSGSLEQEILRLGGSNIHLVGKLEQKDIASLLLQSDVFCLPTMSEGFSTSMLEAAAAGIGIIITNTGGVEELIPDSNYGIVLPNDDPHTIAEAILEFYNNRPYLEHTGNNVAKRVRENFTWEEAAKNLIRLFDNYT